jgi:phage baseplate assembly protein W
MPTKKTTRLYKDVDLDFMAHPLNGDVATKTNEDAVKRSIRNIVLYNKYEKPFMPDFGASIREMLFENVSTSTAIGIQDRIKHIIQQYEPRANVIEIVAKPDINNSQYEVIIEFSVVNVLNPITTTIYLQRVR